jgi:putative oxidoreductase
LAAAQVQCFQLIQFADFGLLALRLMVGLVFATSGWSHVTKSAERSKSIGMSKGFTVFLGVAEVAGALGVAFGVLTQPAALGLILIMLGAIQKKIFVWHIGFWGEKTTVALRPDADRDESGHSVHRWWPLCLAEIGSTKITKRLQSRAIGFQLYLSFSPPTVGDRLCLRLLEPISC